MAHCDWHFLHEAILSHIHQVFWEGQVHNVKLKTLTTCSQWHVKFKKFKRLKLEPITHRTSYCSTLLRIAVNHNYDHKQ